MVITFLAYDFLLLYVLHNQLSIFNAKNVIVQQTCACNLHNAHSFHNIWVSVDWYMYIDRLSNNSEARPMTENMTIVIIAWNNNYYYKYRKMLDFRVALKNKEPDFSIEQNATVVISIVHSGKHVNSQVSTEWSVICIIR